MFVIYFFWISVTNILQLNKMILFNVKMYIDKTLIIIINDAYREYKYWYRINFDS